MHIYNADECALLAPDTHMESPLGHFGWCLIIAHISRHEQRQQSKQQRLLAHIMPKDSITFCCCCWFS